MADDRYVFTHKELVEKLVKAQGLHEGIWGLYVEFGLTGVNAGPSPTERYPAAIVPVLKIGIRRMAEEDALAVDAARVNPIERSEVRSSRSAPARGAGRT